MATVGEIAAAIRSVGARLREQIAAFGWPLDQPFTNIVGGNAASVSVESLAGYADIVASRVERLTKVHLDLDGFGIWLNKIIPQLNALQFNALNQGQHNQLVNAMALLQMIDSAIPTPPPREPKVNWESIKEEKGLLPRDMMARLRAMEKRISEIEPRAQEIGKKITDIENAHEAADQLPTDLAELRERREELSGLLVSARSMAAEVSSDMEDVRASRETIEADITAAENRMKIANETADNLLVKSERALRGATSVGLSKAFDERRKALANVSGRWTVGLAIALILAVAIGWERVDSLKSVLTGDRPAIVIVINAILAVLGIGAPVWFAWLSTKQIGTTFRLSEDYAFKASVAQAYEGYRAEAVEIDDALRFRLFSAALDRFEEAPIRLIETSQHATPLQEILGNPTIRSALEKVPDAAGRILALIPGKAGGAAIIAPVAATAATVAALANGPDDEGLSAESK